VEIIVYSSSSCGHCIRQKEFLDEQGIDFTEKDIRKNKKYFEEFLELGGGGTPFTIIKENNEIKTKLLGFNKERLLKTINNE